MAGGQKKVIIRSFSGSPMSGYLSASDFAGAGHLQLLDLGGTVIPMQMSTIKLIAYVRDFNLQDALDPERLGKRAFLVRPRAPGLWLRLTFRDQDTLEGLAAADVALLDDLLENGGLFLVPPETRSNTQKVFVPRSALTGMEMLGVIRPGAPRKWAPPRSAVVKQPGLFED